MFITDRFFSLMACYTDDISFISSLLDVVLNNPPDSEAMETQMAGVLESFRNNSLSIGKFFLLFFFSWLQKLFKPISFSNRV